MNPVIFSAPNKKHSFASACHLSFLLLNAVNCRVGLQFTSKTKTYERIQVYRKTRQFSNRKKYHFYQSLSINCLV